MIKVVLFKTKWHKIFLFTLFSLTIFSSLGQTTDSLFKAPTVKIEGPFYNDENKLSPGNVLPSNTLAVNFFIQFPSDNTTIKSTAEYRLNINDYHKAWVKLTAPQKIIFERIGTGKFSLEVRRKDSINALDYTTLITYFEIDKNWYRKRKWQALGAVLFSISLILFIKLYSRHLLRNKAYLESKVADKTLQLRNNNEELKRKIVELNSIANDLKETNRLRERLLNILSHDVHSPLRFSAMVGKAVLTKQEDLNKEEIIDAFTDINQTSIRVLLLISNILKWVEYQKENFTPNFTKENLHQLVQDKMVFFRFMADSKNIDLINNVAPHIYITTDKTAFGVIIQNLINNAVKFTPDGEIEINAVLGTGQITISISDTGNGMPPETINAIKYSHTIVPLTDTENLRGNGLGWGLIKDLLHQLKGTFEIKSGEGIGTTVTIILPIIKE